MIYIPENDMEISQNIDIESLENAMENKSILCARALVYHRDTGLCFNLGGYETIMPAEEVEYHKDNSSVKEAAIVTRVNKNVCFVITKIDRSDEDIKIYVSRKEVQKRAYDNYISKLNAGDIIPCTVSHVDTFGVFCDIGCGISALLPIDFISVSRICSTSDRFKDGDKIYACIKSVERNGKVVLTHKELMGTWLENANMFTPLTNTIGIVRSIESYGIFIELTPNLAGLAELCEGISVGDTVNVYIKSIIPDKMKVKLVIMNVVKSQQYQKGMHYFLTSGHIDRWIYSTESSNKLIETKF